MNKRKATKIQPEITIKPEEQNLTEIIECLTANINSGSYMTNLDACFTKGQMVYIVGILKQHQKDNNASEERLASDKLRKSIEKHDSQQGEGHDG